MFLVASFIFSFFFSPCKVNHHIPPFNAGLMDARLDRGMRRMRLILCRSSGQPRGKGFDLSLLETFFEKEKEREREREKRERDQDGALGT